jgi:hypothetical protein
MAAKNIFKTKSTMTAITLYKKFKDVYWASKAGDHILWNAIFKQLTIAIIFDFFLLLFYLHYS